MVVVLQGECWGKGRGGPSRQAGVGGGIAVGAVTLPQFSLDPQESRHDFLRPRRTAAAAWVGAQVFSHA